MDDVTRLIVTVGLLGGPTIVALLYWRLIPARRTSKVEVASLSGETPPALLGDGGWTCSNCRSLNRSQTNRCYHCGRDRDATAGPDAAVEAPPGGAGVAVGPGRPIEPLSQPVGTPLTAVGLAALASRAVVDVPDPTAVGVGVMAPGPDAAAPDAAPPDAAPPDAAPPDAAFPNAGAASAHCPLLQLVRAGSVGAPPSGGATCLAGSEPAPIAEDYRDRYCVTQAYHHCLRYQVATAAHGPAVAAGPG